MKTLFSLVLIFWACVVSAQIPQFDPTTPTFQQSNVIDTGRTPSNQVVVTNEILNLQKEAFKLNQILGPDAINISPKSGENNETYTKRLQTEISYQQKVIEATQKAYDKGRSDAQNEKQEKTVRKNNTGGVIAAGVAGLILGAGVMNGNNRYRSYGGGYYNNSYYGGYGGNGSYSLDGNTYFNPRFGAERVYNPWRR